MPSCGAGLSHRAAGYAAVLCSLIERIQVKISGQAVCLAIFLVNFHQLTVFSVLL